MYAAFYGLNSDPFRLSPTTRPGYRHHTYERARSYLHYALTQGEGVFVLTGEPGTGKSSLVRECFGQAGADLAVAAFASGRLDAEDVLRMVAIRFDVLVEGVSRALLLSRLEARLKDLGKQGRRPVLVVDEAQDLAPEALEEIRGLTNLRVDGDRLLQVFLVGRPSLFTRIRSPGLEPLHQRVIASCFLEALRADEIPAYVEHCLTESGWRGMPSLDDALYPRIHAESLGVPRRVNLICSRLLLRGMVGQSTSIGPEDLDAVLDDLRYEGLLVSDEPGEERSTGTGS